MNEKALISWFAKRRESIIVKKTKEHMLKVVDTTVELDNAIASIIKGKKNEVKDCLKRLMANEKAADNIEVTLFKEITRGDLPPKDREDLMHLVRRIDYIADWIKVSGNNLKVLMDAKIEVPLEIWKMYRKMSKKAVDCTRALKNGIDNMGEDDDAVLRYREEVERLEHEIDDLYFATKKGLITSFMDPRAMIVLADFLEGIEEAVDYCKAAADMLYILVLAGR